MKGVLSKAYRKKYAVGAFNFSTIEILNAIFQASVNKKQDIILSTSEGELTHFGIENAVSVVKSLGNRTKNNITLHLDHGHSFAIVKRCIKAGYPSVHIDASGKNFNDNIRLTKKVVDFAKKKNVWVEGELGSITGSSTLHKESYSEIVKEKLMTDPSLAKEFVEKTNVNALAVSIGNVHGLWRGSPKLDFNRLKEIHKKLKIPLVLHGGSGIPDKDIRKAIKFGIAKINVNTELRIAYANALRNFILKNKKEKVPYKILYSTIPAVRKVVEKKIKLFKG